MMTLIIDSSPQYQEYQITENDVVWRHETPVGANRNADTILAGKLKETELTPLASFTSVTTCCQRCRLIKGMCAVENTLEQALKAQKGSRDIALLFL